MGSRLLSHGHCTHYADGVPQRRVPSIMQRFAGVEVTQGLLSQDSVKQGCEGGSVKKASEQIRSAMANSNRVNTDDTGWRTGGEASYLMGFESEAAVYYQIRERHRNEEVREVIPSTYQGVMCTDRGKSYDVKELVGLKQQKYLSQIQWNLTDVVEGKTGKHKWFASELKALLHSSNELWNQHRNKEIMLDIYLARGKILRAQITHHLRNRMLNDADK